MSEVISIHVGQAGVQIANAVWELFCLEHGISSDGILKQCSCHKHCGCTTRIDSFFKETPNRCKVRPLATIVDTEPSVIDEIRTGAYRFLFNSDQLINNKEDSSNNFARGHLSPKRADLREQVVENLRTNAELCDSLCGFHIYHAMGGGTGSGFLTLLLETLHDIYTKKLFNSFSIFPSPYLSTATVEPYNVMLFASKTLDYLDCTLMFENEAMYKICSKHLSIEQPTYTTINRLISQVASSITASLRFDGSLHVKLHDLRTNLVPFPRLHFQMPSYAPLIALKNQNDINNYTINKLTHLCFKPDYVMTACAPIYGKIISTCLLYRGNVTPREIYNAVNDIKQYHHLKFVEWSLTRFKIGINYQPMMVVPQFMGGNMLENDRALCMLANSTSVLHAWNSLCGKFDLMWNKRAFVHWYLEEGMEEGEFIQARNNINLLMHDYSQI